jgi:hypothetical protein
MTPGNPRSGEVGDLQAPGSLFVGAGRKLLACEPTLTFGKQALQRLNGEGFGGVREIAEKRSWLFRREKS